jgi:type I restriction enzyme, R subunit
MGVTDSPRMDARPLELHTEQQVSLEQLLRKAGNLTISENEVATLAGRLARLDRRMTDDQREELARVAGKPLSKIINWLLMAVDPDVLDRARGLGREAMRDVIADAVEPLASNPELRQRILDIRRQHTTYDEVNPDVLLSAEAVTDTDAARRIVDSWHAYLEANRDEITALQLRQEGRRRGVYAQLEDLATRLARPPHSWTPAKLWRAYEKLGKATPGSGSTNGQLVDLITLIRYELGLDQELKPYRNHVEERFAAWLAHQEQAGVTFTADQRWWLERVRDVVATGAGITPKDLDVVPFTEHGGTDGFLRAFGDERAGAILDELDQELTA